MWRLTRLQGSLLRIAKFLMPSPVTTTDWNYALSDLESGREDAAKSGKG